MATPFFWLLYINDLLIDIEGIVGIENTFAFADDLLICCNSMIEAKKIIRLIKDWSNKFKITMNEKKSAILPLALRKKKMTILIEISLIFRLSKNTNI